jgi:hypothetical protein
MQMNPKLSWQIKLHALLLWGSVGFLMPLGILVIRFASSCTCGKNFRIMFCLHVVLQVTKLTILAITKLPVHPYVAVIKPISECTCLVLISGKLGLD